MKKLVQILQALHQDSPLQKHEDRHQSALADLVKKLNQSPSKNLGCTSQQKHEPQGPPQQEKYHTPSATVKSYEEEIGEITQSDIKNIFFVNMKLKSI